MKLIYTEQAFNSLGEVLALIAPKLTKKNLLEIRDRILNKADTLLLHPNQGQIEPCLELLELDHHRIIEGHYKIIYSIKGQTIFNTDIFDSRQDPEKIKD